MERAILVESETEVQVPGFFFPTCVGMGTKNEVYSLFRLPGLMEQPGGWLYSLENCSDFSLKIIPAGWYWNQSICKSLPPGWWCLACLLAVDFGGGRGGGEHSNFSMPLKKSLNESVSQDIANFILTVCMIHLLLESSLTFCVGSLKGRITLKHGKNEEIKVANVINSLLIKLHSNLRRKSTQFQAHYFKRQQ